MAVTHPVAVRNSIADLVVDKLDLGGGANGTLEIQTAAGLVLAILPLSNPAFGNAAVGVATANAITSDTDANNDGTAAKFVLKDTAGTIIIQGSVTAPAGGGDIELASTTIKIHDTVSISSLTYTAPN